MEQEYSKDMEYGNYCSMDNQAFPIDCETLAALQNNIKKIAATALIAGCDKLILTGCNEVGSTRREGYVFIVSPDNPLTGEILYYKGGSKQDYCHISDTPINVKADNVPFRGAYSVRTLSDGIAGTPILWKAFTYISEINNKALNALIKKEKTEREAADTAEVTNRNTAITSAIAKEVSNRNTAITSAINKEVGDRNTAITNALKDTSVAFIKGMIIMWSGTVNNIPSGWALCDGQSGRPDLRNRFIIGAGGSYGSGSTGGSGTQSVTLSIDNMPSHNHSASIGWNGEHTHTYPDTYYTFGEGESKGRGAKKLRDYTQRTQNKTTYSSGYHNHTATIGNAGGGKAFSVSTIPPYYALCFIIKL